MLRRHLLLLCLPLALAACITPYRTGVQQGNVITQEMAEKLKPGMTRSQVRFVLGTPLISDPFHQQRWDYVYWLQQPDGAVERKHLGVIFDNDQVLRFEGDPLSAFMPEPASPGMTANDETSTGAERPL